MNAKKSRCFFDTNILLYPLQVEEAAKRERAHALLASTDKGQGVISYQVLQEYCNACLRKFTPKPRPEKVYSLLIGLLEQYEVVPWTAPLLPKALEIHYRYQFAWYDSFIVTAALEAGCETLYTEDLQHGQKIESMTIINPFV